MGEVSIEEMLELGHDYGGRPWVNFFQIFPGEGGICVSGCENEGLEVRAEWKRSGSDAIRCVCRGVYSSHWESICIGVYVMPFDISISARFTQGILESGLVDVELAAQVEVDEAAAALIESDKTG